MKPSIVKYIKILPVLLFLTIACYAEEPEETYEFDPMTVTGQRGEYPVEETAGATKTLTPIYEIPQSIQVIPRQIIDDQVADTLTEVIRNISGIQGKTKREALQTQINGDYLVRGFFTEAYVNGRQTYLDAGLDPASLVNIEQVLVLKGPSSSLYSGGVGAPVGGVINLIEKSPMEIPFYEVEGRIGSFDLFGTSFDVNQPLSYDGKLALRVTGDYAQSEDFVDEIENEYFSIYPTLSYKTDTTEFTLRLRYQDQEYDEYIGLPTIGTVFPGPAIRRS